MYQLIVFLLPPACLTIAALTDFFEMTIPNWVSIVLIGAFVLIAPFSGFDLITIIWHFAAAFLVFSVCFTLFALNVMGGGDAKLLTAASLWFGFNHSLFEFLAFTGYLGGALTIFVILLRANWDKLATVGIMLPPTLMAAKKIPYAIAIGAAGLMTYPNSSLVLAAVQSGL
jgi:prepilin peptidase CpaA